MATAKYPGVGSVPKGKGGSNRKLDGPGVGKSVTADNTRGTNPTAASGGKAHPSLGPGRNHESYKNSPKDLPTLGDKPPRTPAGKW